MTTKEIADKLISYCREGNYSAAQKELYSKDAVSIEPEHSQGLQTVKGLDAIFAKEAQFQSMIETVHGGSVSDALVAGNYFALTMTLDITLKGMGRMNMHEIALYEVKDGKIIKEQFYY